MSCVPKVTIDDRGTNGADGTKGGSGWKEYVVLGTAVAEGTVDIGACSGIDSLRSVKLEFVVCEFWTDDI